MSIPTKKLKDGTDIPVLGFGTFMLEGEKCTNAVKIALDIGFRHIDTAEQYDNQKEVGKGISGFPRSQLFVTSKLQFDYLDPKQVEARLDGTLKDLGIDYLDLYLIHWPNRRKPLSEIIAQMHKQKEKGKLKNVGVSNFSAHHIKDLSDDGLEVQVNQVEFHPYLYQKDLLDFCNSQGIAITAYSPLAHGEILKDPIMEEVGKAHGKSAGQVSLRWLIQKGIIVVPKGSSEPHIRENFELFDFELTKEEEERIDGLNKNYRIMNPPIQEFDY